MINGQRVIAVEEHFATSAYLEVAHGLDVWPGDQLEMRLMRGLESTDPLHSKLTDFDVRLQEMEACGIDMTLLSLNPPGVQPYDEKSAVPLARDFNDGFLGEDSILFATDFPYEDSAAEAGFLSEADLTGLQRAKISHANAERVFRIPASGSNRHPQA